MNIEKSNIANLPTRYGKFKIRAYKQDHQEHLAIMSQDFETLAAPYVRIHSECLTGDTLGSLKCDCQNQLDLALKFIAQNGGLVIYHRQEGRNIGLLNKVNAYALQDQGRNTIEANLELGFGEDDRDYGIVEEIFKDLNIKKLKLITNNPEKIKYVESLGVEIVERIPAITKSNKYNENYINTKKEKMGHMF
ncbi:GTP cyclohydrolase II [Halarcobacter anaerophilus]|uniref:GTP cyclohydrolase-2 n=1 Tax=Halarcobacter anaerophilus TaxID=877500 RepID=A0A4Q0Y0M7_9BACT|nr:GTP cyclohydrolase II [Halarcobacter anaerophilus]QDF28940.1 GTP cyclohydrolase II [Halarcobacter anaerophilus]RXJ63577.1 GTP cyclohydrolase II [Halarcobacter anaerophilus]